MGKVISLEEVLIERKCTNPFNNQSSERVYSTKETVSALNFIASYSGFDNIGYNIRLSLQLEVTLYSFCKYHQYGIFDDFLENFKVREQREDLGEDEVIGEFNINKPDFFNQMLKEKELTPKDIFKLGFRFYIQAFIDFYNGEQQVYRLNFKDKKTSRRLAMQNGDQRLLDVLNKVKYIHRFTEDKIIML